jgi:hypothetical protein
MDGWVATITPMPTTSLPTIRTSVDDDNTHRANDVVAAAPSLTNNARGR